MWKFSQKKVISIAEENGCTGGPDKPSAGNTNIFRCPDVGKLSFRFTTTTGNQLRALTFEIIQRQLKSVGIELVPRFQLAGRAVRHDAPVAATGTSCMFTWVELAVVDDHDRRTSTAAVATRTT